MSTANCWLVNIAFGNPCFNPVPTMVFQVPVYQHRHGGSLGYGPNNNKSIQVWEQTANGFRIRNDNPNDHIYMLVQQCLATNVPAPTGGTGLDLWAETVNNGTLGGSFNIHSVTKSSTIAYDYVFTIAITK